MIHFEIKKLVLLSTVNLRLKGGSENLRNKFVGPFRSIDKIGVQNYKLELPQDWKLHPVFYISLLKRFCEDDFNRIIQCMSPQQFWRK